MGERENSYASPLRTYRNNTRVDKFCGENFSIAAQYAPTGTSAQRVWHRRFCLLSQTHTLGTSGLQGVVTTAYAYNHRYFTRKFRV